MVIQFRLFVSPSLTELEIIGNQQSENISENKRELHNTPLDGFQMKRLKSSCRSYVTYDFIKIALK